MSDFISRIGSKADYFCMGCIDAGVAVKRGALWVGEEGSRAMHEMYSLDGFEKGSKVIIADLRFLSLIPSLNGVFRSCIKTVEAQRDIIYATLVFGSTAEFIKPEDIEDKKTGKKKTVYSFQVPTEKKDPNDPNSKLIWDWVKILYFIGNYFETAKFIQRYQVLAFPRCTQLANQLGSIKLFNYRGDTWTFGDIPVANCWCNKPKDFFVFSAAFYTFGRCLTNTKFWTVENMLKLTASIGKMVLVSSAEYMLQKKYYLILSIVDFVTNNASLLSFLIKRHNEREKRLIDPTKA